MTICDYACSGPSLLKAAKEKFPNAKLFAYNPNGIGLRLKRILEKELDSNVNIIMEMKDDMKFCKIIMNPPYDKNLHLKILQEAMKHSDDIVNLSPIRWLQDPLAEYKKNSDWKRFSDIRKHIESLDVIDMKEACDMFDVPFMMDLGIYHITKKGGWDASCFKNSIINKVEEKADKVLFDVADENKIDGWRCRIQKISPVPSNRMNSSSGQARQNTLCHHSLDWVYKDGLTKDGKLWNRNVLTGAGKTFDDGENIPISIKFNTEEEAYNFQAYTKTKFFKYIYSKMKTDQNVPLKYLPYMPTYKHEWTDEMLYQYFDLTQEEIDEIECSIS